MIANSPGSRRFLSSRLGRLCIFLYIAAVAVGSLAFAVWLFTFIGNGGYTWRIGVTVAEARLSAPADRLGLRVSADCTKNSEVSRLVETDVDVQVAVVADATPFLHGVDCGGSVRVQLQEPLGDRNVVDKNTGNVVRDASSHTWVSVRSTFLRAPDLLFLYASTCDEYPEVSRLVETDVDVQLEVVADSQSFPPGGQDCQNRASVRLKEPLGDRDVVDKHTGKVVRDASSYPGVSVRSAFLKAPDVLHLYINTCDESPEASHLVETDVDVRVKVVTDPSLSPQAGQDCLGHVPIRLQEPLGDRNIVDKHAGEFVRLQSWEAEAYVADLPDVPAPKIGDAPNEAELEDLQFIAIQEGISLQTAIERYGWRDNFSLAASQIEEAVPDAFIGAEIVDDSNAWIAFNRKAPQEALDIINTFRSSHSWVSVQIRTGK